MEFEYFNPVKISFDVEFEEALRQLFVYKLLGQNCLLITSKGWIKRGVVDRIKAIISNNDLLVLDSIDSNPELGDLQLLKSTLKTPYDAIIALGGGSVLDSAKFFSLEASVSVENGELKSVFRYNIPQAKPIFAFPTTAGGGR